jgi:hypothetical protein
MENKFLIDIGIKYGLDTAQVSKLVDMLYQCGCEQVDSRDAQRIANYICETELLDKPAEEIMEELKLKRFFKE